MAKEMVYFKKNVNYNIGVRMFPHDSQGRILTGADPYVGVELDNLRDFKQANKNILIAGLLISADEPSVDWETSNALSDTEIAALVKNHLQLKQRLPGISSLPILYKLIEEAKSQERAKRILNMIQARIDELEEEDPDRIRQEMQGVQ